VPKLTKKIVDNAELRASPYFIWCSDLPGFGVRVFPSGKRVYYADYRNRAGARKRMSLGPHGKLTTEEARKLAVVTLADVLKGEDPAEERATRRNSLTVRELCDNYLKAAEKGLIMGKGGRPKKASTLYTDRGRIERHIKPLLGTKLVRDVAQADVNRFIRDVASGKTAVVEKTEKKRGKAVVEGGAGTAARTAGLLGGILSFAVSEGVIQFNPAQGVKRPADKRRDRRLTAAEFKALGEALDAAERDCETWQGIAAVRLMALTGFRKDEIISLRWAEVDEEGKCFRLAETKEGTSVRPLTNPVMAVLRNIERKENCPFVLPAVRSKGAFGGWAHAWGRIAARAKLGDVTAHTFRHSFGSVAGDLGFSELTIGAMLGHAAGSVTSRYVHHLDSVLVAAADKVARSIHAQMTGVKGTVVQMPKRARSKNAK